MIRGWIASLLLLAASIARAADAPPEFRAAWAAGFHDGYRSAAPVTAMIDTLAAANYNALVLEVRKCGDTYNDSAYRPRIWSSRCSRKCQSPVRRNCRG